MTEKTFSHIDEQGKASMVDVGEKTIVHRIARAAGFISLQHDTIKLISENKMKKGDVLTTARIAGISSAKQTHHLIPLCHPLLLDHISVDATLTDNGVQVESQVKCTGRTGVEMEALTAVSVTLLTIYDMCKAVDKMMVFSDIKLISKEKS